ncbi:MAG TPA: cation:proton antiporter [Verrucomicrobiae bacterium]
MKRTALLYLLMFVVAIPAIMWVLHQGASLPAPSGTSAVVVQTASEGGSAVQAMFSEMAAHSAAPLGRLFMQLLVIIAASRVAGMIATRLGQPAVIGEMTAGILLGPSLFGAIAPETFAYVFKTDSLGVLKLFSQIGVCLFMFVVGMELNVQHVKQKAHAAVLVSHTSIVFPFFLGVVLAWFLYTNLAAANASFLAFALFMGISMSITAFPVLARILQERGLTQTSLGSTAITCAAVDDVTAWSILAFVVAIARATSLNGVALNLVAVLAFIAVMIWVVRPLLNRSLKADAEVPSKNTLAGVIMVVMASSFCTEVIGIHALFGAFLAGAIMPNTEGFREKLAVRVENFSSVLLLPLFFAYTGLRTQVGLLNDISGWMMCLVIIAVATLGKLGGSAISARFTGMSWSESLQLGALMNTRGLMELIALNIGYDMGILSPRIFAMLVIMALVTTMMTGPLLTLFSRKQVTETATVPLRT